MKSEKLKQFSVSILIVLSLFIYAGLPGEPVLGLPAFMHRLSAMDTLMRRSRIIGKTLRTSLGALWRQDLSIKTWSLKRARSKGKSLTKTVGISMRRNSILSAQDCRGIRTKIGLYRFRTNIWKIPNLPNPIWPFCGARRLQRFTTKSLTATAIFRAVSSGDKITPSANIRIRFCLNRTVNFRKIRFSADSSACRKAVTNSF